MILKPVEPMSWFEPELRQRLRCTALSNGHELCKARTVEGEQPGSRHNRAELGQRGDWAGASKGILRKAGQDGQVFPRDGAQDGQSRYLRCLSAPAYAAGPGDATAQASSIRAVQRCETASILSRF